jgi:hypothetical protein
MRRERWREEDTAGTMYRAPTVEDVVERNEEADQVVPPPRVPFRGCPASLTEGG